MKKNLSEAKNHYIIQTNGCNTVLFLLITIGTKSSSTKTRKPFGYTETFPYGIEDFDFNEWKFLRTEAKVLLPGIVRKIYLEIEKSFYNILTYFNWDGIKIVKRSNMYPSKNYT